MPKLNETLTVPLPVEQAVTICRQVISGLGWRVVDQRATGLRGEEPSNPQSFNNPVKVELELASTGQSQTRIEIHGSVGGIGPIQKNHLKRQLDDLQTRLEAAAQSPTDSPAPAPPSPASSPSLTEELEKLAAMHKDGVLSESDFQDAKQVLIGGGSQPLGGEGSTPAAGTAVFVNRTELSREQLTFLEAQYGASVPAGRYWYDAMSGAWGIEGGPTTALGVAGLDLPDPIPADISGGGTGIFINGREIHPQEQMFLASIFGGTLPGRYWMDSQTNIGMENGPPLFNLQVLLAQSGPGSSGVTRSAAGTVAVDGDSVMFSSGGQFWSSG